MSSKHIFNVKHQLLNLASDIAIADMVLSFNCLVKILPSIGIHGIHGISYHDLRMPMIRQIHVTASAQATFGVGCALMLGLVVRHGKSIDPYLDKPPRILPHTI